MDKCILPYDIKLGNETFKKGMDMERFLIFVRTQNMQCKNLQKDNLHLHGIVKRQRLETNKLNKEVGNLIRLLEKIKERT